MSVYEDDIAELKALIEADRQRKRDNQRRCRAKWTEERRKAHIEAVSLNKKRRRRLASSQDVQRKHDRRTRAVQLHGSVCVDCGGSFHPAAFDFHHVDPKTKTKELSRLWGCRWELIEAELSKCIMLCSNCHRIRHWGEEIEDEPE